LALRRNDSDTVPRQTSFVNLCPGGHEETMMSNHDFRDVLTADDRNRIERQLAELPESSDRIRTISVFLPGASQVLMLLTEDEDIVSWCLMPARDQGHAHELTVLLHGVLRRQVEIVCRDVKTLADAAIGRASRAARRRRTDTYPGEWDCGGV
jgi:hypothetical protein